MRSVVYDAGALIAADRNDRRLWADHRARLEVGMVPLLPSSVLAQVSRSPRQVQLRRFVAGCEVVDLGEAGAHRVGAILGKSRTSDVVDAAVVELAIARGADVVTSDANDIRKVAAATGPGVGIVRV